MERTMKVLVINYFISTIVEGVTSMGKFLRKPSQSKQSRRPLIHTFICVDECAVTTSLDDKSIIEWAEIWSDSGWEPVVVTEKDAKRHPKYGQYIQRLKDSKLPPVRWYRYLRHLAMAMQENGGWYADTHIMPLVRSDQFYGEGFVLPNEGKFTMYEGHFPHLISADKNAWELFSYHLVDDLEIKIDAVLLSALNRSSPDVYFKKNSMMHVNDILDSDLKPNVNCTKLETSLATSISDDILGDLVKMDYYKAINIALEQCNPVIYTFFENAYSEKATQEKVNTSLEAWKKAWSESGWRPVVLNLEDAKLHSGFKEFEKVINSGFVKAIEYEKMCFYRWLAVAVKGGGWMADIDTYPLHMNPKIYGHSLPHGGEFTSHCWKAPCLVSGSEEEWNRVIPMMLDSLKKHNDVQWSDMFAMQEILDEGKIIREMGHANIHEVHSPGLMIDDGKDKDWNHACNASKYRLVMHFSHYSCEKTDLCHKERGANLNQWLDEWKMHCTAKFLDK